MSKADVRQLEIISLGAQGDGIADVEGGKAYVPFTLPGERVEARLEKVGAEAWQGRLERVVKPASGRRAPICQHFTHCGGCALQHMGMAAYADWQVERINMALSQHGIQDVPIHPAAVSPLGSRRRLDLKMIATQKGVVLGYHAGKSRHVIDLQECPVARHELVALFDPLRELMKGNLRTGQGCGVRLLAADTGIGVMLELPAEPDLDLRMDMAAFAEAHGLAYLGIVVDGLDEPVAARRALQVTISDISVDVTPASFLQATKEGEQALQAAVAEVLGECDNVVDLFAGIGTFGLDLARTGQVCAVEGDRGALAALMTAANRVQGLRGIESEHRDLFRRPLLAAELARFDGIVIDPPRAGAKAQMAEIAASSVPRVAAVSCNPNTFARDARILLDGGYKLKEIWPVDQFLFSAHVELVARFERD